MYSAQSGIAHKATIYRCGHQIPVSMNESKVQSQFLFSQSLSYSRPLVDNLKMGMQHVTCHLITLPLTPQIGANDSKFVNIISKPGIWAYLHS